MSAAGVRSLAERYEEVLREENVDRLRASIEHIEERLRFGKADGSEPPLFAEELLRAREQGETDRRRLGSEPPSLLLLIVGYSPEPLLLAVAYHAPRAVLLLRPNDLADDYLERDLPLLWDRYHEQLGVPPLAAVPYAAVRDSAADLFRTVDRVVRERRPEEPSGMVLDITGAKKTMTGGAFLAAGFHGLEASYVDFEAGYDKVLRRPRPGAARPGRLDHPERLFRLREQARLAEAFDARRYDEADQLARELAATAGHEEVVTLLGRDPAGRLAAELESIGAAARAYALWRDGFYADAADALGRLPVLPVPPQVELLSRVWPRSADQATDLVAQLSEPRVFADPSVALAYFLDVLVWITEAHLTSRPRSGFIRLYGALEALFTYSFDAFAGRRPERLAIECAFPEDLAILRSEFSTARDGTTIDWMRRFQEAAVKHLHQNAAHALQVLGGSSPEVSLRLDNLEQLLGKRAKLAKAHLPDVRIRLEPPPLSPDQYARLTERQPGRPFHLGHFRHVRNRTAHWMAPVPVEFARELRRFFQGALSELIPLAAGERRRELGGADLAARERLDGWCAVLLRAAAGELPAASTPLTLEEVRRRLA